MQEEKNHEQKDKKSKVVSLRNSARVFFIVGVIFFVGMAVSYLWGQPMGLTGGILYPMFFGAPTIVFFGVTILILCTVGKPMRKAVQAMGELKGKSLDEIAAQIGRPNVHKLAFDSEGNEARISVWRQYGYSIVMKFDEHEICLGVLLQQDKYLKAYDKYRYSFRPMNQTPFDEM